MTKTSILVTAGTGKTTACKALRALGYHSIDIETVDGLYQLIDEQTGQVVPGDLEQIREGIDWNCNRTKLEDLLRSEPAELTFYCGGMANTEDVWDVFDAVIVLTVSDKTTVERLTTRQPGEFGNSQQNRDWVLSWKHEIQTRWLEMGGIEVSAEASPTEVAEAIIKLTLAT